MPAVTMLTLLLLLADMAVGSTSIPLKELWRSLTGNGSDESIRYIIPVSYTHLTLPTN